MITKEQAETLAKEYQIDGFTIMREYLQLLFLSYLYQGKLAKQIYFKGGTAIRLLFGSPRFSEDLDFSTLLNKLQIKQTMEQLEKVMQKELPALQILSLYSGKTGIRYRIKYQSPSSKYPLTIRLDFTIVKKIAHITVSPLITRFPILIFPLVSHLSGTEILAEKLCALATRDKGRDLFDIWYLLEKGVVVDKKLIRLKFLENKTKFNKNALIKKVGLYPQNRLNLDLAQFLPKSQREITKMLIGELKEKLVENFGK
ncbi:MAG TPA: hypothetical protein DEV73_00370 [Candidatus Zambryskibacteria bacterium]|nr:MAG: hypothetical protein UX21_C0040G0015 [Microgenomates group bacterium GW2011_GWC2_45_8]HCH59050.1 hypothetical protein [Candidatus Zambryskibacteria bacterium]